MFRRIGWLTIVIVLIGPAVGAITYRIASRDEAERAFARFEDTFSESAAALEKEIWILGEALHATKLLFDSSENVTRDEFGTFTRRSLTRHPEIRALAWAPRSDVEGRRTRRYAVSYREPSPSSEALSGEDLAVCPLRHEAIARAIDTGEVALTEPLELCGLSGGVGGFLGLLAVYEGLPATVSERRARVKGLLVVEFETRALLDHSPLGEAPARMHYRLHDVDGMGVSREIDATERCRAGHAYDPRCSHRRIEFGGRCWHLSGHPTEAFMAAQVSRQPVVLGVAACLLWGLLGGLLLLLAKGARDHAIRRQDRLIRAVCHSLDEGVVVADRDGRFILYNEAAERMVGRGSVDVPPESWSEVYGCFLPDGKTPYPAHQLPLARAIRGEKVSEEPIFVRHPRSPEPVWLSASGVPLRDEDGELAGGVTVLRDVSQRRRSEEAVRRLSMAVDQAADSVFITDRRGEIQYVNPAFESTTGFSKDEVLGRDPRLLVSTEHDGVFSNGLWSRIRKGEVYEGVALHRRKNGELYHAEQTITPMFDAGGRVTHCVSVGRDVSERLRRREQEIEMHLASEVQRRLYPADSPCAPGLDVAGQVHFAEATCGDYFDYVDLPEGRLGLVIGDVSGHGLVAALIMTQVRAYLRTRAAAGADVAEILDGVNGSLSADLDDRHFVTLLLVDLDPATGRLAYANAGHTPGYVLDALGDVKAVLGRTGLPLGIHPDRPYGRCGDVTLEQGETLVLVTDGVTEARSPDGRLFEEEGALEVVRDHRHETARVIVDRLQEAVDEFGHNQPHTDDVSMVVCRRVAG